MDEGARSLQKWIVRLRNRSGRHNVAVTGSTLRYLEAGPPGPTTVLLLHGGRFTSETWRELGTIATLADAGHHVIAFDLPDYGNSERSQVPRNEYLNQTLRQLWPGNRFIIVSPSMRCWTSSVGSDADLNAEVKESNSPRARMAMSLRLITRQPG